MLSNSCPSGVKQALSFGSKNELKNKLGDEMADKKKKEVLTPIFVCHQNEFRKISARMSSGLRSGDENDQKIHELMGQTIDELLNKISDLIRGEIYQHDQVYIWLPDFMNDEGTMLRVFWRNNFHWELAVKTLTKQQMKNMRVHWSDDYVYGKGCLCDEVHR